MTSIDIIECSRSNAVGGTNSNWTNVYASPVEVGMGDIIQVKTALWIQMLLIHQISNLMKM